MLVGLLGFGALWATARLLYDIVEGTGHANSARDLLAAGALAWLGHNLAFALFGLVVARAVDVLQ